MKHFYRICIALCASILLAAPHTTRAQERCHTMQMDAEIRRQFPQEMGSLDDMEHWIADLRAQAATRRDFDQVLLVPVVVHVIHNGETVGSGRNISDEQVLSQIKVLNQDYRRIPGTRGSMFNYPDAVDAKIQFVLAKRDPSGRPTDGINRVNSVTRGWAAAPYSSNYTNSTIKPGTVWDANRYLNFWCVDFGNSLFGYAQFPPTTGLLGMPCSGGAAATDGVAVNTRAFGSMEDGNFDLFSSYPFGRTMTHELGHYLGLRHIWGDASCGTDYCEDTPIHQRPNYGCTSHPQPNNCGTPDEMFENYMDYSDDACLGVFTRDQSVRMRAVILNGPRRSSLLSSPALRAPLPNEVSFVGIETPGNDVCGGPVKVRVRFNNTGVRRLTDLTVNAYVDGVLQSVASFSGRNIAFNSTDTLTIPGISFAPGTHNLTLIATDPNNSADSARGDTIEMPILATTGRALPFIENFEVPNALPLNWSVQNPNSDCNQWLIQTMPGGSSATASAAAFMPLFNYTGANQRDELYSPLIDLTNENTASLTFRYSHARASANNRTTFQVEVSNDCGETFTASPVLTLTAAALLTAGTVATTFIPSNANQWATSTVNLTPYVGQRVRIRFVTINGGGGNNLYLDNIGIETSASVAPQLLSFSPDTASVGDTVTLRGQHLASLVEVGFVTNRRAIDIPSVNDSTVKVIVPAGAVTGVLKVTTLGGYDSTTRSLVIMPTPNITSFTPGSGNAGITVTLTGTSFVSIRSVYFNGQPATSFTNPSRTRITAVAPNGVTTGPIRVEGKYGLDSTDSPFIVGSVTPITTGLLTTCSALFTDPAGLSDYAANLSITQTVRPAQGNTLTATFLDLDLESGYDFLEVYDGTIATGTPIAKLSGSSIPSAITATNAAGALTFRLTSDQSIQGRGFIIQFSCDPPPPPLAPGIVSFSPILGNIGTQVVITGPRIGLIDSVWFNDLAAVAVSRISATQVQVTVPAGATTGPIRVKSNAIGSDTSLAVFTILEIPAYCIPAHPTCSGTSRQYITEVSLAGTNLSNSTECGTTESSDGYSQYLPVDSTQATLKTGGAYKLSVNTAQPARVAAWLDANRNGIFESSEFATIAQGTSPSGKSTLLIRVPAAADTGLTVLRVRSSVTTQQYASTDACESRTSGEAEDYIVHIVLGCDSVAVPSSTSADTVCRGQSATIVATASTAVRWYNYLNDPWVSTATSYTIPAVNANTVVYLVGVTDNCESPATAITILAVNPVATFTVSGGRLTATTQGTGYTYRWFSGASVIPGATSATHDVTQTGTYSVEVTFYGCSNLGASRTVIFVGTAKGIQAASLNIWPNPTHGKLNIEAPFNGVLLLTDAMGRVVFTTQLLKGQQNLSLPSLSSGIYLTKYISSKGVSVQSLEVK